MRAEEEQNPLGPPEEGAPEELDAAPPGGEAAEGTEPADLYEEGGVVTAGLPAAPPEQGAEDAVRTYLRSIGKVPLLTR